MTAAVVRLRPIAAPMSLAAGLSIAGAVGMVAAGVGAAAPGLALLSVLIAATLLVDVDLPRGGVVPLGHAVILGGVEMLPWGRFVAVGAVGLLVAYPVARHRDGAAAALVRVGGTGVAMAAAAVASQLVGFAPLDHVGPDSRVLAVVAAAGAAFFTADFVVRGRLLARPADRIGASPALPVYLTLLCAAALLAIGANRSLWLALVAAVPLLVTRFSFRRYAEARHTYEQTVEALSLLPEVARHVPLGHGARSAFYAEALVDALGFDEDAARRVVMAARLHHVGHISLHDPDAQDGPFDVEAVGRTGEEILRETGFLADLAELVASTQLPTVADTLESAVIKVCSTLDDLTAGDAGVHDPFVGVLGRHGAGLERKAAIGLLRLHDRRPDLLREAADATAKLVRVATGSGHSDHGDGHDPTHDCR